MSTTLSIGYETKAAFYDIDYDDTSDHTFLRSLIKPDVKSILEIPCGSGRNLSIWVESGLSVVAVDREPAMLTKFQNTLHNLPGSSNVSVQLGDMTTLELNASFDLIVVPKEAFQLIPRNQAIIALSRLAEHLSENGYLLIDLYQFDLSKSHDQKDLLPDYYSPFALDNTWTKDWEKSIADGEKLIRRRRQVHNTDQTVTIDFSYERQETDGASTFMEMPIEFNVYNTDDFRHIYAKAGLISESVYSDYDRTPFHPDACRNIHVLRAKKALDLPPTGRLSNSYQDFNNDRDFLIVEDFTKIPLDEERVRYFKTYLESYFNGPFEFGMGAEDILDVLSQHAPGGKVLDIGAGTASGFWLLPVKNITSVTCNDVVPEALFVLQEFLKSNQLPQCYADVLNMHGLSGEHWDNLKGKISEFAIFNSFAMWPALFSQKSFDTITAFGVYSIAPNEKAYRDALENIKPSLNLHGRLIGTDWVRKKTAQDVEDEGELFYLNRNVIFDALVAAGFEPLEVLEKKITGDPIYERIIIWVAKHH